MLMMSTREGLDGDWTGTDHGLLIPERLGMAQMGNGF